MRNLLFFLIATMVATAAFAGDLRLEDSDYSILAYIRDDGRIENASFETLGYIREECTRIEDASFHTLGYIDEERIEDDSFTELFRITDDGRITDDRFRTVARITSDGTVEDNSFNVILYTDGTDAEMRKKIAIYLIFFSDLLPSSS